MPTPPPARARAAWAALHAGDAASLRCKWSLAILATLHAAPCRTLALRRRVAGISMKVLTERLRALEAEGWIACEANHGYPRVVRWSLTARGRRLAPALAAWAADGLPWGVLEMILRCAWTLPLLDAVAAGERSAADLRTLLPGASRRTLFERLAWLADEGVIARHVLPTRPPRVRYALAPLGTRVAATVARLTPVGAAVRR